MTDSDISKRDYHKIFVPHLLPVRPDINIPLEETLVTPDYPFVTL